MAFAKAFGGGAVESSEELTRIRALPRHAALPPLPALAKTPDVALRPIQILALQEIIAQRGALLPIRVGGGKTLISILAPGVLNAKRPVLLLPAALRDKTERERRRLSVDWHVSLSMRIVSYEELGRVGAAGMLDYIQPDLIVADECLRLKRPRAAVTRRVMRYMRSRPETMFVGMSGTILSKSLGDFAHLAAWALKYGAPVPLKHETLREWEEALDPKVNPLRRRSAGALLTLHPGAQTGAEAFRERFTSTPGIVASAGGDGYAGALIVSPLTYAHNAATHANFDRLRTLAETPDGWALTEAVDVWRVARQLALGMHYVWSPRPPEEWLLARRQWAKFVRDALSHSRTLDSELQVTHAVERGTIDDDGLLAAWRAQAPTFEINVCDVWHDDCALIACTEWLREPGIVWVEHSFFGRELARRAKVPYFGAKGVDADGRPIEDAAGIPCVASVAANGTGRNLQAWSRNLITAIGPDAARLEQLIGRTHRDGQAQDEVTLDVIFACGEHVDAWERVRVMAADHEALTGQSQKILVADIVAHPPVKSGAVWQKGLA